MPKLPNSREENHTLNGPAARMDQIRRHEAIGLDELQHDDLRQLVEAWRQAVAAEGLSPPSREHFTPTDIPRVLERVMVLERAVDPAMPDGITWRYRLVGTGIADRFGHDVTGNTIEVFHPPLRAMVREQLERVYATGEPMAFTVESLVDYKAYDYEKVILPVRPTPTEPADQMVVASRSFIDLRRQ